MVVNVAGACDTEQKVAVSRGRIDQWVRRLCSAASRRVTSAAAATRLYTAAFPPARCLYRPGDL